MGNSIQNEFNKYQAKYPLYNVSDIVELMLKDGIITSDIAINIKSGKSLFCFDNSFYGEQLKEHGVTEIFGGYFSNDVNFQNKEENIDLKNKPFSYVKKVIDKRVRDLSNQYELKNGGNSQLYKDAQKIINLFKKEYGNLNSSSMQYFYEPYYKTYEKDDETIGKMRSQYERYSLSAKAQFEEESALVKKYKLANCGECADLVTKICYEQFKDKYDISTIIFDSVPSDQDKQHFAVLLSTKDKKEEFIVDLWINPEKGCIFRKNNWNLMCKELYNTEQSNLETYDSNFKNLKYEQQFWDNISIIKKTFPHNEIKTVQDFVNLVKDKINKNEKLPKQFIELYYMYGERYTDYGQERDNFKKQKLNYIKKSYDNFYKKFSNQSYPENLKTLENYLNNVKINSSFIDILIDEAETLISNIDKSCYGWGQGENKKELMQPLLKYIVKIARLNNCQPNDIDNFEKNVNKELNATFYTNEKQIISAVKSMLEKIKRQYEGNSYLI